MLRDGARRMYYSFNLSGTEINIFFFFTEDCQIYNKTNLHLYVQLCN